MLVVYLGIHTIKRLQRIVIDFLWLSLSVVYDDPSCVLYFVSFINMEKEERIRQIEREVQQLSMEMMNQQEHLNRLRKEVLQLKGIDINTLPHPQELLRAPFSLENFIGLKLLHLVGIVVLVIGLSIGVKYAIDEQLISEVTRIVLAYAAGGLLFFLSLRLKANYTLFSAILFSGAMASLYFTTYAAFVYYHMFPFWMAFLVMVVLTGYTTYGAINYTVKRSAFWEW